MAWQAGVVAEQIANRYTVGRDGVIQPELWDDPRTGFFQSVRRSFILAKPVAANDFVIEPIKPVSCLLPSSQLRHREDHSHALGAPPSITRKTA